VAMGNEIGRRAVLKGATLGAAAIAAAPAIAAEQENPYRLKVTKKDGKTHISGLLIRRGEVWPNGDVISPECEIDTSGLVARGWAHLGRRAVSGQIVGEPIACVEDTNPPGDVRLTCLLYSGVPAGEALLALYDAGEPIVYGPIGTITGAHCDGVGYAVRDSIRVNSVQFLSHLGSRAAPTRLHKIAIPRRWPDWF